MKQTISKDEKNEIIDRVNQHNDRCYKVGGLLADAITCSASKSVIECYHTMVNGNLETGIQYCCLMSKYGFDAVVDRIDGSVVSRDAVDTTELLEDGVLRYLGWEFAEDDSASQDAEMAAAYYIDMLEDCMIPENRGMIFAEWANSIENELEQEVFDEYFADESQDTKNWFVVYHNEKKD